MKSYYCKRLYEEINFDAEHVYVCCGKSLGPSFDLRFKKTQKIDLVILIIPNVYSGYYNSTYFNKSGLYLKYG